MKAFLIGLLFLLAAVFFAGVGILVFPLLVVLGFFLKMIVSVLFVIFAIWLLGRFIILIWGALMK